MKYQLQLGDDYSRHRYIITGNEWFHAWVSDFTSKPKFIESTGNAIIYPEHDLLWIGIHEDKTERFKTLENFEKEFNALPRWEATRYAVIEAANNYHDDRDVDGDLRAADYGLFLYDCRTGQRLIDVMTCEPVPGRESEVARLRRDIEPMMRGESFSFM